MQVSGSRIGQIEVNRCASLHLEHKFANRAAHMTLPARGDKGRLGVTMRPHEAGGSAFGSGAALDKQAQAL